MDKNILTSDVLFYFNEGLEKEAFLREIPGALKKGWKAFKVARKGVTRGKNKAAPMGIIDSLKTGKAVGKESWLRSRDLRRGVEDTIARDAGKTVKTRAPLYVRQPRPKPAPPPKPPVKTKTTGNKNTPPVAPVKHGVRNAIIGGAGLTGLAVIGGASSFPQQRTDY